MALQPFHHDVIYKTLNGFGALFSEIYLQRSDSSDSTIQALKVPIRYGPKEQGLSRDKDNSDLVKEIALTYPRLSFELLGLSYDPSRAKNRLTKTQTSNTTFMTNPAPYNIGIALYILTKNSIDGYRILEQILPKFMPSFYMNVENISGQIDAMPVTLGSVQQQDNWQGSVNQQREIVWTLSFTVQTYMYGPTQDSTGLIKQVIANFKDYDTSQTLETGIVQPGLTANGQATSNVATSIDYKLINKDDPYGIITIIE